MYDLINGYAHKHSFKRILINMRNTIVIIIGVAILVLAYLLLVFSDKLIYGMGIYKDPEAVNLFGLLILILPLVELLAFLERKFRPHLIIEMKHEIVIED